MFPISRHQNKSGSSPYFQNFPCKAIIVMALSLVPIKLLVSMTVYIGFQQIQLEPNTDDQVCLVQLKTELQEFFSLLLCILDSKCLSFCFRCKIYYINKDEFKNKFHYYFTFTIFHISIFFLIVGARKLKVMSCLLCRMLQC